jgi:hypothetical protein
MAHRCLTVAETLKPIQQHDQSVVFNRGWCCWTGAEKNGRLTERF